MGKVRKQWPEDQIQSAISAFRSGEPIKSVSIRTGIPISTLRDKLNGKMRGKVGAARVFTTEEEKEIVESILHWNSRGFPVTKALLINNVECFVKKSNRTTKFTNDRPGRGWYKGFLQRHQDVSSLIAQNLTSNSSPVTEEKLKAWFEEMQVHLDKIGTDTFDGSRIFTLDLLAFFLSLESEIIYSKKRYKTVNNFMQNDEEEFLTVLFTTNTIGMLAPPMALFKFETIPDSINESAPADWIIEKTSTGWITAEALFEYVTNVFHPWLTKNNIQRPIVLYIDGHSSNVNYSLAQFCFENQIELISLLPNSKQILQPLDVALFKPLKEAWRKCISNFRTHNQSEIQKEDFCKILKSAVDSLNLPDIMCNGFRKTGLYPFTPNALNFNELFRKSNLPYATTNLEEDKEIAKVTLQYSESFIDSKLLQEFKIAEKNGIWGGDPKHESLFIFWLAALKCSSGITIVPSYEEPSLSNISHDETSETSLAEDKTDEDIVSHNMEFIIKSEDTSSDVISDQQYSDEDDDKESMISLMDNRINTPTVEQYSNDSDSFRITDENRMESLLVVSHHEYRDTLFDTETKTGPIRKRKKQEVTPSTPNYKTAYTQPVATVAYTPSVATVADWQKLYLAEEKEMCKQQTKIQEGKSQEMTETRNVVQEETNNKNTQKKTKNAAKEKNTRKRTTKKIN